MTVIGLKSENPAAPHEDSVQVHGQDGEAKDLVNLCGRGSCKFTQKHVREKTFERKKRCEEMTLRLCSTSACMCLHTFAHMPCLKYIAVCCMPCKENCYGSDIVWVLLCEDATHDLREWNTVGHATTIPTDKYTHTHTGGSKVAVCKISSTIPCLWLIRFYQLLWVTMRSNCVEMLRASQSHCMLRHCVLFNRNGSLDLNVLKDTDCTLLNPGWTVTTLSATAIRLQDLTKTLQKHPSYFDIFLKLLRIS